MFDFSSAAQDIKPFAAMEGSDERSAKWYSFVTPTLAKKCRFASVRGEGEAGQVGRDKVARNADWSDRERERRDILERHLGETGVAKGATRTRPLGIQALTV